MAKGHTAIGKRQIAVMAHWNEQLDDEKLDQWRKRYRSAQSISRCWEDMVDASGLTIHEKFFPTLAHLMHIGQHDARKVVEQYDVLYRWDKHTKERVIDPQETSDESEPEGSGDTRVLMPNEQFCEMKNDTKVVLSISSSELDEASTPQPNKAKRDGHVKWVEWFEIRRSKLNEERLGLYAARQFAKGAVIGFIAGRQIYRSGNAGEAIFPDAPCEEKGGADYVFRDFEGYRVCVRSKKRKMWQNGKKLYLGLHYMMDALTLSTHTSSAYEALCRLQNCVVLPDGSVMTLRKINVGDELLGYRSVNACPARMGKFLTRIFQAKNAKTRKSPDTTDADTHTSAKRPK